MKIKKGDTVVILAGKDKGKKAKVIELFEKNDRVLVEGINMYKKHQKARRADQKGQVVDRPMPIHVSNVAIFSEKDKKGVKTAVQIKKDKKVRVSRKSGVEV